MNFVGNLSPAHPIINKFSDPNFHPNSTKQFGDPVAINRIKKAVF